MLSSAIENETVRDYLLYAPRVGILCSTIHQGFTKVDMIWIRGGGRKRIKTMQFCFYEKDVAKKIFKKDCCWINYTKLADFSLEGIKKFLQGHQIVSVQYDIFTINNILRSMGEDSAVKELREICNSFSKNVFMLYSTLNLVVFGCTRDGCARDGCAMKWTLEWVDKL